MIPGPQNSPDDLPPIDGSISIPGVESLMYQVCDTGNSKAWRIGGVNLVDQIYGSTRLTTNCSYAEFVSNVDNIIEAARNFVYDQLEMLVKRIYYIANRFGTYGIFNEQALQGFQAEYDDMLADVSQSNPNRGTKYFLTSEYRKENGLANFIRIFTFPYVDTIKMHKFIWDNRHIAAAILFHSDKDDYIDNVLKPIAACKNQFFYPGDSTLGTKASTYQLLETANCFKIFLGSVYDYAEQNWNSIAGTSLKFDPQIVDMFMIANLIYDHPRAGFVCSTPEFRSRRFLT